MAAIGLPELRKGGVMAPVPKKVKQPLSFQNARGVLCAPAPAKLYEKVLCGAAVPLLLQVVGASQLGSVLGGWELPPR